MRGGAGGQGDRGGLGGIDAGDIPEASGDVHYFRGALRPANNYFWGATKVPTTSQGAYVATAQADTIRTIPHWFPRAGTIGKMGWWPGTGVAGSGPAFRWAIYSDNAGAPDTLLYDSGSLTSWNDPLSGSAISWKFATVNLDVEAMTVYHLAWKVNTAFATAGINTGSFPTTDGDNVLGLLPGDVQSPHFAQYPTPGGVNNTRQNGWRVAHSYTTAYPTTFPVGAVAYGPNSFTGDGALTTIYMLFTYAFAPA
jgi:hypothetical protein